VVLCLLNNYQAAEPAAGQELVSRGQVVLEAIGAEDLAAALQRAAGLPLARLRGFRL
jgi:hypothetical protein